MRDLTQNVGNVLTIQHQTCVDEIFKCTIFVGYGGVIFFTGVPPNEVNDRGETNPFVKLYLHHSISFTCTTKYIIISNQSITQFSPVKMQQREI